MCTCCATCPLQLGINLDPNNNGFGGVDHGILLQARTVPDINLKNGLLRFGRGLSMDAVVYWQVCGRGPARM